jgi:3-hydroxyisobutyrate dehydrogenase
LAKSINQAVYLSYVAAVCESVALGARGGLDVPVLLEVLRRSVGGMPMMTQWEVKIATQDLRPGFEVRRVLKDLSMAEAAASDLGFAMPILNTVVAAFESAATTGHTGDDMTALYQMKRVG